MVELSTKALLRSRGVEYPKFHDTSPALLALKDGLPEKEASFLAKASEELSRKRALAMYGDEARASALMKSLRKRTPGKHMIRQLSRSGYAAGWHQSVDEHNRVGRHPGDQPSSS